MAVVDDVQLTHRFIQFDDDFMSGHSTNGGDDCGRPSSLVFFGVFSFGGHDIHTYTYTYTYIYI